MNQAHEVSIEVNGKTYRAWYYAEDSDYGGSIALLGARIWTQLGGSREHPDSLARQLLRKLVEAESITEDGTLK